MDGAHYTWQLERVKATWFATRPAHLTKNGMILLDDNASLCCSEPTMKVIFGLEIDVLPHPAYSPDLALIALHYLRSLKD